MKACIIYLVRHGESVANSESIIAGQLNSPLTELGKQQAMAAAKQFAGVSFDAVYSSDLARAVDTASIISGTTVKPHRRIVELRERHFGVIQGLHSSALDQARERQSSLIASQTKADRWRHSAATGMESNHQVSERFIGALQKIAESHADQTVLVGTHGGAIRITLIALGYAAEDELPSGSFMNAGYVKLAYKNHEFTVLEVNGVRRHQTSSE